MMGIGHAIQTRCSLYVSFDRFDHHLSSSFDSSTRRLSCIVRGFGNAEALDNLGVSSE